MRVAVTGAAGRMGIEVCRTIDATDDLELVAAVDPQAAGSALAEVAGIDTPITIAGDLEAIADAGADVAVDFTHPSVVGANLLWLLDHGIHAVVGTTGIADDDLQAARQRAADGAANAVVAPNFAIGAVLMMQFSAQAARHLPSVEIVELHHDRKADAPSGTALRTAELIAGSRTDDVTPVGGDDDHPGARGTNEHGVPIHSVRLPGLVAHQQVQFGGQGETLTIRHDSLDRSSFMPGVLAAIRGVSGLDGLVVGLEHVL